jgi:uncharacterized protein YdeI (YjbR/CyaY-like superfamily)
MKATGPLLRVTSAAEWRAWLQANHAVASEVWLLMYKKHTAIPCVSLQEATEEALCFGWIDSLLRRIDDEKHALRYGPRKKGSIWSERNKKLVAKLIEQGRMTEAGFAAIEEAKRNGEWEKATRREDISRIPSDLGKALAASKPAQANFEKLAPSHKKQYLTWIASAKTEPTRSRRIQKTVTLLRQNKKLSPSS